MAIVAIPTAVTGFFGLNLSHPGFGTETGFLASCGSIVAIALAFGHHLPHK